MRAKRSESLCVEGEGCWKIATSPFEVKKKKIENKGRRQGPEDPLQRANKVDQYSGIKIIEPGPRPQATWKSERNPCQNKGTIQARS